jgi:thymidylate synthase (FAD)
MCSITLEINTTRDIAHQIVRHRSFAFQEFSQRYADPAAMGYPFEIRETRLQDEKNRQNSVETDDILLNQHWIQQQKRVTDIANYAYKWAIENGIAKEQARTVLPEGLTKTRLYMAGTLRSWIHYIDVRSTPGTQKEHMEIARECAYVINPFFPMIKDFVHD